MGELTAEEEMAQLLDADASPGRLQSTDLAFAAETLNAWVVDNNVAPKGG